MMSHLKVETHKLVWEGVILPRIIIIPTITLKTLHDLIFIMRKRKHVVESVTPVYKSNRNV